MTKVCAILLALVLGAAPAARAQETQGPADVASGKAKFGAYFGYFETVDELKAELAKPGRCPAGQPATIRQPCALIMYSPLNPRAGAKTIYFRPVFLVTAKGEAWTAYSGDRGLRKVKLKDLYGNARLPNGVNSKEMDDYLPFALVGNFENAQRCAAHSAMCLNHESLFGAYTRDISPTQVHQIWR